MNQTVVAVFDSSKDADAARKELIDIGIPPDDLHVRGGSAAAGMPAASDDRTGFWRRVLGSTDAGEEPTRRYAEAERRGNAALVVEDVEPQEAASIETTLAAHGVLDVDRLAEDWRARGWRDYDENAPALSSSDLDEERRLSARSRADATSRAGAQRCVRVYTMVIERSGQPNRAPDRQPSVHRAPK